MASLSVADERLVRELYAAHAPAIRAYARRLLGGDQGRAEDVVQETLLREWQHPAALERAERDHLSIRSWLLTVARHLVIDGQRRRAARPVEVVAAGGTETLGGLDPAIERVIDTAAITQAVRTLSPEHRQVVVELYLHDRSVAETAARLGVPEGTVKSRAYHAIRALRVAMAEPEVRP